MSSTHLKRSDVRTPISKNVNATLEILLQATRYSVDTSQDAWQFAVELDCLRKAGITSSDMRWLMGKGWVNHAYEITVKGAKTREFRGEGSKAFSKRSCFILTSAGVKTAEAVSRSETIRSEQKSAGEFEHSANAQIPHWDPDRRQLRLGEIAIKEFKTKSPNQEAVLAAFEEEGWPPCIDDPLTFDPKHDQRQRLRNTIKSLNRNQVNHLIQFMGDGTGEAIRWEWVRQVADHGMRGKLHKPKS